MDFRNQYTGSEYLNVAKKMVSGFKTEEVVPPKFKRSLSDKPELDHNKGEKGLTLKDKLKLDQPVFFPETVDDSKKSLNPKLMYLYSESDPHLSRRNFIDFN